MYLQFHPENIAPISDTINIDHPLATKQTHAHGFVSLIVITICKRLNCRDGDNRVFCFKEIYQQSTILLVRIVGKSFNF